MISWLQSRIDPFAPAPAGAPPDGLLPFYRHHVHQVWPILAVAMVTGMLAAVSEVALFGFLGGLVDRVREAASAQAFLAADGWYLAAMLATALVLRPAAFVAHSAVVGLGVTPGFTNLIRWQNHQHVLRESVGFFQNDFAGRIASRIMQTGAALRESVVELIDAIWFMAVYTVGALVLFTQVDWVLGLPLLLWALLFVLILRRFVPRIRDRAVALSHARSLTNGRIVDSYTNITTVKLFAHLEREDDYARQAIADHNAKFLAQQRLILALQATMSVNNGVLIAGTTALAVTLWVQGLVTVGAIALATALAIRLVNMAGWISWVVTSLFENVGTVQEGMETIAVPHGITDLATARPLHVRAGAIDYEGIRFHYGREGGVIDDLSLRIEPGQKVGLVGRSGAGKSTLVNLLLRFHDLEAGRILIDGQDIADVTQDSLRAQIGVVTQDTSLLHRSIRDNILYGRPAADDRAVREAARRAHAHAFIPELTDYRGRRGFDAQVGERGVKLSGGQRQRIAIARVLLKDAPILVLDEATSALDSEVEAAIQEQLHNLMAGKTVIAIAHRLSTIAAMDRLVILDCGRIVEEGTHASLVRAGGLYAELWARQSGGFLCRDEVVAEPLEPAVWETIGAK
jgi:ATP-binding cassette subfamily B multidrug efflux pump